jgi:hypothetical protein
VTSEILNRGWPRSWSSKICAGSTTIVVGKATSGLPMDQAIFSLEKRTYNGCDANSMSRCGPDIALLWRKRVLSEPKSVTAEVSCILLWLCLGPVVWALKSKIECLNISFIYIIQSFTTLFIIDLGLLPYTRAYSSFADTRVTACYCERILGSKMRSLEHSRVALHKLADTARVGRCEVQERLKCHSFSLSLRDSTA